jgi:hypothetical protein
MEVNMFSQIPYWMSFVITFTYIFLIVLVVAGPQRALNMPGAPDRRRSVLWGLGGFLTAWLSLVLILGLSSFFITDNTARAPRVAYALIPFALSIIWLLLSASFRGAIDRIPPQWIIVVQSNRILGALFLVAFAQGQLPALFAFPAGVGDVLVSLAAPIVAYLLMIKHPRAVSMGLLWNAFGILDLLLAIALGVLTSPGQLQRFAFDTPNLLMSAYPFVVIPVFGVPVWLLLHLVSLRGLIQIRSMK